MKRIRDLAPLLSARLARALAPVTALALALAAPVPASPQASRVGELRFPPLPAQEIPQPRRVELPNGMVVMLLENHELPLVEAIAIVRAGSRLEPAAEIGLAELTGTVRRTGGTGRMSGDELDDYLEGKAASIESSVDSDSARASMNCLKEDFPEVLAVFADVLRRPAFAEDKLAIAKGQMRARLTRQNDSSMGIMFREARKVVYGPDSPYARTPTFATLDAIGADDLAAWHRRHFHPERMVLGLVGDFDTGEALRLVEQTFGDWPRGTAAGEAADVGSAEVPAVGKGPRPGVYYVEKTDVTQSSIVIGGLGILRTDPDFYALEVMNQVFSGGFSSRLVGNVRTRKGLAYTVFGQVGNDWDHLGMTMMMMTTKTATTAAGIDAMLEEARGMTASPPTEEEVAKAKGAILNSHVFSSDTKREVLNHKLRAEYYGYPLDWLERYRQGIEAVTVDAVRAAAAKHLVAERLAIVVVGPSEGTDRPLSAFGPVTPIDIRIPGAAPGPAASRPGVK